MFKLLNLLIISLIFLLSPSDGVADVLLSAGSEWRYMDDGNDQGTDWREWGFDDSGWSVGNAQFGFGDPDVVITPLTAGFMTYYFRTTFNIPDASIFSSVTLKLLRDDGAVVYLNGNEVVRSNMPFGTNTNSDSISFSTPALTTVSEPDESSFFNYAIPPSSLLEGTNLLAVEVHQKSLGSTDLHFDLELMANSDNIASSPDQTTFAVIGDFGSDQKQDSGGAHEGHVASMVIAWNPDFVATVGDNNYDFGAAKTMDANIGKHYRQFIGNYPNQDFIDFLWGPDPMDPEFTPTAWICTDLDGTPVPPDTFPRGCEGSAVNKFFPALGNHDWWYNTRDSDGTGDNPPDKTRPVPPRSPPLTSLPKPHEAYFDLPGNEEYYVFRAGPVEIFVLNSINPNDYEGGPDDTDDTIYSDPDTLLCSAGEPVTEQASWLKAGLQASTTDWQFVVLHHAPFSSGEVHGSIPGVQCNYKEWGADAVLSGHDHLYEVLAVDGIPYFVNGLGGDVIREFDPILDESLFHFNNEHGAMLVDVNGSTATFEFYSTNGTTTTLEHRLTVSPGGPTADAGGPYAGTVGVPVQFDGAGSSGTNTDPVTYNWDFGDATTGTGVNPSHSYSGVGVYNVTLVVNDGENDSMPDMTLAIISGGGGRLPARRDARLSGEHRG